MIGHFNAGELAGYRAGTVSDGKAARISAHLSSCSQCAAVDSGLANVSRMLSSIPAPTMPDALTQRLHAAIADEAAQRAARTAGSPLAEADRGAAGDLSTVLIPGRPDLPKRSKRPERRPRVSAWSSPLLLRSLAAAGALVLLVGGGILLANQRSAKTSGGIAAPTARSAQSPASNSAAVGSMSPIRLHYRHAGQLAYANAVTTDVNYTKANLPADVRHEVANSAQVINPSAKMPASSSEPAPQHMLNHTTVGQLQSCLSTVTTSSPGLVLLVEVARYLGAPATIIVFRGDNVFDVIVVGGACGPTGEDIITRLVVPTK